MLKILDNLLIYAFKRNPINILLCVIYYALHAQKLKLELNSL